MLIIGGALLAQAGAHSTRRADHALDADALLEAADEALYRAKDAGRNCVVLATPGEQGRPAQEAEGRVIR